MTRTDVEIVDQTEANFLEDSDTQETLSNFARGFISKNELADRLAYLLSIAKQRAERRILGPQECDTGVTDDSDAMDERKEFQADQMRDDGGDAA